MRAVVAGAGTGGLTRRYDALVWSAGRTLTARCVRTVPSTPLKRRRCARPYCTCELSPAAVAVSAVTTTSPPSVAAATRAATFTTRPSTSPPGSTRTVPVWSPARTRRGPRSEPTIANAASTAFAASAKASSVPSPRCWTIRPLRSRTIGSTVRRCSLNTALATSSPSREVNAVKPSRSRKQIVNASLAGAGEATHGRPNRLNSVCGCQCSGAVHMFWYTPLTRPSTLSGRDVFTVFLDAPSCARKISTTANCSKHPPSPRRRNLTFSRGSATVRIPARARWAA